MNGGGEESGEVGIACPKDLGSWQDGDEGVTMNRWIEWKIF